MHVTLGTRKNNTIGNLLCEKGKSEDIYMGRCTMTTYEYIKKLRAVFPIKKTQYTRTYISRKDVNI